MEINLIFLISVIPAIILFGIAKSGLGGSIALISIPLMTLSMSLTEALAIMLPILIFSDFIAVYRFRKDFDLETLKLIIPSSAIGIIIGSFTFSYFSEDLLKSLIGLMGFLFASHYFIFKKDKIKPHKKNKVKGILFFEYLFLAGMTRFIIEFVRLNPSYYFNLTGAQYISLIMIIVSIAFMYLKNNKIWKN